MDPTTKLEKAKAKEPGPAPTKFKVKLNVKPPKAEAEVSETEAKGKTSDEEFLLTLLNTVKVDHETASKSLGINKAACRMRFIRLQQKYGFKKKGKGTPRRKQVPTTDNEEATTEKDATPTNESDVAEEGANEGEATEN